MGCEGLPRVRQWALMGGFGRLRALVLQQSQPPGNLSSHCSGSLSVMIKSVCRRQGGGSVSAVAPGSLASSCEPLKLGSVDPQMGWGLGICILNTTTPVPQPPLTSLSLYQANSGQLAMPTKWPPT